jgi:cation:H+ antiporter
LILPALACLAGFVLLAKAADEFVIGAARLSALLRVSPIVIGAVVIGLGTSSPELFVSTIASASGDLDLGVGNILGSNLANLSLVLGVAVVVVPFAISSKVLRREAPLSAAAAILFALLLVGGLSRVDGVVMLLVLALILAYILRDARTSDDPELVGEVNEFVGASPPDARRESVRTALGLIGTLLGAQALVWGATEIATEAGLSEGFVGLTLVAIGTSLPELVTTLQAARRGEDELIVGNLLGSNIFNSLAVGGAVALAGPSPLGDPDLLRVAAPVMLVAVGTAWLFMWTQRRLDRWEGAVLVGGYVAGVTILAV